jgi:hypothetical protein
LNIQLDVSNETEALYYLLSLEVIDLVIPTTGMGAGVVLLLTSFISSISEPSVHSPQAYS